MRNPPWNDNDRKELKTFLDSKFGERFMARIKHECRVKGKQPEAVPGYDLLVLAGLGFARSQGQASVFEAIDESAEEIVKPTPLPEEFTRTPKPSPKPKTT